MSKVIMSHYRKAPLCQIFRKFLIAADKFNHPVNYLKNCCWLSLIRLPLYGMNLCFSVGGQIGELPFLCHGCHPFLLIITYSIT